MGIHICLAYVPAHVLVPVRAIVHVLRPEEVLLPVLRRLKIWIHEDCKLCHYCVYHIEKFSVPSDPEKVFNWLKSNDLSIYEEIEFEGVEIFNYPKIFTYVLTNAISLKKLVLWTQGKALLLEEVSSLLSAYSLNNYLCLTISTQNLSIKELQQIKKLYALADIRLTYSLVIKGQGISYILHLFTECYKVGYRYFNVKNNYVSIEECYVKFDELLRQLWEWKQKHEGAYLLTFEYKNNFDTANQSRYDLLVNDSILPIYNFSGVVEKCISCDLKEMCLVNYKTSTFRKEAEFASKYQCQYTQEIDKFKKNLKNI